MIQHIFPTGGVWQFVDHTTATVTRDGCYPEVFRVDAPLTREQAHALLLATPGVGVFSSDGRERELIRAGSGPDDEGQLLGYSW